MGVGGWARGGKVESAVLGAGLAIVEALLSPLVEYGGQLYFTE